LANASLRRTVSFQLLDADAIAAQQVAMTALVGEELYISNDEADCLLRAYHFDLTRLRSEWFADTPKGGDVDMQTQIRRQHHVTAAASASASSKTSSSSPPTCDMMFCDAAASARVTSLNCGHGYCDECWRDYLQAQVNIGRDTLYAVCPGRFFLFIFFFVRLCFCLLFVDCLWVVHICDAYTCLTSAAALSTACAQVAFEHDRFSPINHYLLFLCYKTLTLCIPSFLPFSSLTNDFSFTSMFS
jgi:hypothetical protein